MSKQTFDSVLDRYLAGTCTDAERKLVEQWYDLIGDEAKIPNNSEEWDSLKTRMWTEIHRQHKSSSFFSFLPINGLKLRFAAAAVILVSAFAIYQSTQSTETNTLTYNVNSDERVQNNSKQTKIIHLTDGSSVHLSPDAELVYPKQFEAAKREVSLKGEAFFEVAKNAKQPFYVYANGLVTKVIGTSFVVKAASGSSEVQVAVRTGKVSVYKQENLTQDLARNHEGVVILPNQQLNFNTKTDNFTKTVAETPTLLQPSQQINFNFEDASASEVLKNIQKAYGIQIIFDEELLKSCPFTADLSDEPLYGKIALLCQAIEATYETIDGQIVVSSSGCQ